MTQGRVPTQEELAAARRALKAIANNISVAQPDALALRLWAGPKHALRPLREIANAIINEALWPPTHFQPQNFQPSRFSALPTGERKSSGGVELYTYTCLEF